MQNNVKEIGFKESINFELSYTIGPARSIMELKNLKESGVYFLHEGSVAHKNFNILSTSVVYIGKAISETIQSRCAKHLRALNGEESKSIRPGKRFKSYRDNLPKNAIRNIFVIPAFMDKSQPHLISCAEEYFLLKYLAENGRLPAANSR
jgi:hypothetical protein